MDDQFFPAVESVFEILQSAFFFICIYALKAMTLATTIINNTMHDENWMSKLGLTIAIIVLSFFAIKMVYNAIMSWIRFAFKFGFILGSIAIMVWIWNRGLDGSVEDLRFLFQFWTEQYYKYESQAKSHKAWYDVLNNARDAFVNERQRVEGLHGRPPW